MAIQLPLRQIFGTLLSLLILAAGVGGFMFLVNKPAVELAAATPNPPAIVETVPVRDHTEKLMINVDGVVVPFREIRVAAEVSGRIAFKASECRAGNFVEKGTELIRVDPSDYELEVRRLKSLLKQAESDIRQLAVEVENNSMLTDLAMQDLKLREADFGRLQSLADARAASDTELDQAKQAELAAQNTLQSLKNQARLLASQKEKYEIARELAETQLDKAKLDLRRTKIIAPVDGVIVSESAEQDDYVQKGSTLLTVEDTSAVEVKCKLRMDELYWLWRQGHERAEDKSPATDYEIPEMPVTVVYQFGDSGAKFRWEGVLSRFDGIGLDELTRTVPCRVVVDEPRAAQQESEFASVGGPPALVRGMFVTVEVALKPTTRLVRIPEQALRPGKKIWVARNNQLEIHGPITLIERVEEKDEDGETVQMWIVDADASGLEKGAKVIESPLVAAYSKMPIEERTAQ